MTFDTNVAGTVNVFEAVRKTPSVKVLVNITSDKCYENREWVWGYRENDPMGGLHEAKLLKLNCDKAHAGLNWHSILTIDECLQMTAEWYKIFYAGSSNESTYKFCTKQIAEYVERAKKRSLNCADKRATQL